MLIGERVRVERWRGGRVVVETAVVTRSDSWNGVWVGRRATGERPSEIPLGEFVKDDRICDDPPAPEPRPGEALGAVALLLAAGALAAVLAFRAVGPRLL